MLWSNEKQALLRHTTPTLSKRNSKVYLDVKQLFVAIAVFIIITSFLLEYIYNRSLEVFCL